MIVHQLRCVALLPLFVGRIPPFDMACTNVYAEPMLKARAAGLMTAAADRHIVADLQRRRQG
ncbi:MAG: hypothetical protein ACTHKB_12155 [Burkholderiaceae bacterium]